MDWHVPEKRSFFIFCYGWWLSWWFIQLFFEYDIVFTDWPVELYVCFILDFLCILFCPILKIWWLLFLVDYCISYTLAWCCLSLSGFRVYLTWAAVINPSVSNLCQLFLGISVLGFGPQFYHGLVLCFTLNFALSWSSLHIRCCKICTYICNEGKWTLRKGNYVNALQIILLGECVVSIKKHKFATKENNLLVTINLSNKY